MRYNDESHPRHPRNRGAGKFEPANDSELRRWHDRHHRHEDEDERGPRGRGRGGPFGPDPRLGFGGPGGPGGSNASFGTVASVNGRTVYLTETSGNTVKVKLSASTKISKSQSAGRSSVRPGDTVVVTGVPNSSGTVVAASLTDSGAGRGPSGASAGGGASSSGSRSAVGSLFSPGG